MQEEEKQERAQQKKQRAEMVKMLGVPMCWHRLRILTAFAQSNTPLTDREAFRLSQLDRRAVYWKRCNELRKWKLIKQIDMVECPEEKVTVARCEITKHGRFILGAHLKVQRERGANA